MVVNPDLLMNTAAFEAMFNFMEAHPQAGICGPKVLESDSVTISPWCARRDPQPWDVFCEYAFLTRLFPRQRLFARYVMGDWDHTTNREVDALTGACLLVRREVIEQTGGFDETILHVWRRPRLVPPHSSGGLASVVCRFGGGAT